jgi:negative regulator of sigma E activity
MSRRLTLAALLLACWLPLAQAAPDAAALVGQMRAARLSTGFELRLQTLAATLDGTNNVSAPQIKIAVIGQFEPERSRLSIRGIAPEAIRGQPLTAEYRAGCLRAAGRDGAADPFALLFGTPLVVWDMLTPWWDWPEQTHIGNDQVAGRACTVIRSRSKTNAAPVREVQSCIDAEAGLSLRTRFFDAKGQLLRTAQVLTTFRAESGRLAAKKISITPAGQQATTLETYSGDEHYEVPADTFVPLERQQAICH